MFVADIMTRNVKTIGPETKLQEVSKIFRSVRFRHLLVEDGGLLIGIISDRDMLANLSPFTGKDNEDEYDRAQLELPAKQLMSTAMITVDCETLIDSASILLIEQNISCLPVVNHDNSIAGILSWKDILQYHVYGIDETVAAQN